MNPSFPTARCFWEVMWMFYDRSPGRLRTVVDFTITAIMRSAFSRDEAIFSVYEDLSLDNASARFGLEIAQL